MQWGKKIIQVALNVKTWCGKRWSLTADCVFLILINTRGMFLSEQPLHMMLVLLWIYSNDFPHCAALCETVCRPVVTLKDEDENSNNVLIIH